MTKILKQLLFITALAAILRVSLLGISTSPADAAAPSFGLPHGMRTGMITTSCHSANAGIQFLMLMDSG